MTEKQALNEIYQNLKAGEKYGYICYWDYYENKPYRYPHFRTVLVKDDFKPIFHYQQYGSSAIKANKVELTWLIEDIFQTSAIGFLKSHITESQAPMIFHGYNKLLEGGGNT